MWFRRRSTKVPVTKGDSAANVRRFAETCNIMRADKEKIASLNEQGTKQTFKYTVEYQDGALEMRISETGHLLGQSQFKQYRDDLIPFEMRMK